jgi:hypothetical protein
MTTQAFATTTNRVTFATDPRIENAIFQMSASWATHGRETRG